MYICICNSMGSSEFGINFTSVRLSGNKIARGEAECYLPPNLTRVEFVPVISRWYIMVPIYYILPILYSTNIII